jgi:hypothetical protein
MCSTSIACKQPTVHSSLHGDTATGLRTLRGFTYPSPLKSRPNGPKLRAGKTGAACARTKWQRGEGRWEAHAVTAGAARCSGVAAYCQPGIALKALKIAANPALQSGNMSTHWIEDSLSGTVDSSSRTGIRYVLSVGRRSISSKAYLISF